jgi:serine/threonine-protein kinase SRPK3
MILVSPKKYQADCSPYDTDDDTDSVYTDDEFEGYDGYKPGGYQSVHIGENYKSGRYTILQKLGWGHFSTVWLVNDNNTGKQCAMKVQKSSQHYMDAALDEFKLLQELNEGDPEDIHCCVKLIDQFSHCGTNGISICFISETLGNNLLSVVKKYKYRGIPISVVRKMCLHMLVALDYIHSERKMIHTDFKPENIMLRKPSGPSIEIDMILNINNIPTDIYHSSPLLFNKRTFFPSKLWSCCSYHTSKAETLRSYDSKKLMSLNMQNVFQYCCKIVDFGNACWTYSHFTEDIQTRQYRSPEVILGLRYTSQCDIWSLACVIFELVTGDILFDPREDSKNIFSREANHLSLISELLGPLPRKTRILHSQLTTQQIPHTLSETKIWPLREVLIKKYEMPELEANALTEFLSPMLEIEPEERATARHMLQHPWLFEGCISSNMISSEIFNEK